MMRVGQKKMSAVQKKTSVGRVKALRWAVILIGIGFIIIGTARGEVFAVFVKATNVCLECVGIG